MKAQSIILSVFILFAAFTVNAQNGLKKDTIKVWGNCGMCKETIEGAAKKAGATSADWNEESKELKVSYAVAKTSSEKIQKKIAKAGYDTKDFTASDKAYKALHGCCKYDRKDSAAN